MSTDFDIFGRKTARSIEPSGSPPRVDPALERYDAVPSPQYAGQYKIKLTNHLPIRRISAGAGIIPAEVGDTCIISFANGKIILWAITEGIPFREACP
jgi:hypothetical protein